MQAALSLVVHVLGGFALGTACAFALLWITGTDLVMSTNRDLMIIHASYQLLGAGYVGGIVVWSRPRLRVAVAEGRRVFGVGTTVTACLVGGLLLADGATWASALPAWWGSVPRAGEHLWPEIANPAGGREDAWPADRALAIRMSTHAILELGLGAAAMIAVLGMSFGRRFATYLWPAVAGFVPGFYALYYLPYRASPGNLVLFAGFLLVVAGACVRIHRAGAR